MHKIGNKSIPSHQTLVWNSSITSFLPSSGKEMELLSASGAIIWAILPLQHSDKHIMMTKIQWFYHSHHLYDSAPQVLSTKQHLDGYHRELDLSAVCKQQCSWSHTVHEEQQSFYHFMWQELNYANKYKYLFQFTFWHGSSLMSNKRTNILFQQIWCRHLFWCLIIEKSTTLYHNSIKILI